MTCILFKSHFILSILYLSQNLQAFCRNWLLSRFFGRRGNLNLFISSIVQEMPINFFLHEKWVRNKHLFVKLLVYSACVKEILYNLSSIALVWRRKQNLFFMPNVVFLCVLLLIFLHAELMLDSQRSFWSQKLGPSLFS